MRYSISYENTTHPDLLPRKGESGVLITAMLSYAPLKVNGGFEHALPISGFKHGKRVCYKNTEGKKFMSDKAIVCKEFITDGINRDMCNVYEKIPLPLYPSPYEIETFCKTSNHLKCPIRNFAALMNSAGTETREGDVPPASQYQK